MDPPASSTTDAMEQRYSNDFVRRVRACDPVITATTPTGSTELLPSSRSAVFAADSASSSSPSAGSNDSSTLNISDQENKDIVEASAESLALSAAQVEMPFLLRRAPKTSPRNSNAGAAHEDRQASTPLMESAGPYPQDNRTSPLLHLPLPPDKSLRKLSSAASNANAATPPSAIKNALLTRKAQKYSSLKKRRAPNNILNRLFCSNGLQTNASGDDDLHELDIEAQIPTTAPSEEDSTIPSSHCKSCVQIGCDIVQEASESLTLHDEAIVRNTVQTTLSEISEPSPAHKTFAQLRQAFQDKSTGKTRVARDDDSTSIATPRMKISMVTDDLDDLASASSSIAKPIVTKTNYETPNKKKKKSSKVGPLVIPPQFRNQSSTSSTNETPKVINNSPPQQKRSSSRSRSPIKKKDSKKSPTGMSLTMSTASTAETSHTSGSDHASMPPEMIRITSSLEDLSTVPEMSTSKETSTRSLDENELTRQTISYSSSKISLSSSVDALARAQSDLRHEFQEEMTHEIKPTASQVSVESSSSSKINSLKDQLALANRLATLRLDEIRRLESTMDESQEQSELVKDLNNRLVEIEKEKDKEIQIVKQEMEEKIAEIKRTMVNGDSPSNRSTSSTEQVVRVQQELDQARSKLEENQLDVELESQLHILTDELAKVKRELDQKARELCDIRKLNEELAVSTSRSLSDNEELMRVKKELADVTEHLANTSKTTGRPPIATNRPSSRSRSLSPSGLSRTRLQQENDRLLSEKESLRVEVDRLMKELDSATMRSSKHGEAMEALRKQLHEEAQKERNDLSSRLANMHQEHEDEKSELLQEISKLREKLEDYCAVEEAMQITSNEHDILREQLQEAKAKLLEAEAAREELSTKLKADHEKQIAKLEGDLRCNESVAGRMEQEQKQTIESLRNEHEKERSSFMEQLKASDSTRQLLEMRLSEREKHLQRSKEEVVWLEGKLQKASEQYEKLVQEHAQCDKKMAEVEDNQNKQFEELLGQLDLVEKDYNETISARNKIIVEKEAAISTLASQLADERNKNKELEQELAEQQACKANQVRMLEKELAILKQTHEMFVEEAEKIQEEACQEAREEMIAKAEAQFQQANQHYIKLRKQFEESQLKVKKLESQVRASKKTADELMLEKQTAEADLKAQLAKLLAAKANSEADFARRTKDHKVELDEARRSVAECEEQIERAEEERKVLRRERDKATKEYEDMKALSEELMILVESNGLSGNG